MKIGIVGSGAVGATAAYALVMRGVGSEIVLVDKAEKKAKAEAADILHAVPFAHPLQVRAGDYPDLKGSGVVIVAAGVGQKPGETRLQLLARNGVGSALARIVSNILWDRRAIMTVCTPRPEVAGVKDVTVSLPSLVGGEGVLETFPQPLNPEEEKAPHASAATIRRAIDELDQAE